MKHKDKQKLAAVVTLSVAVIGAVWFAGRGTSDTGRDLQTESSAGTMTDLTEDSADGRDDAKDAFPELNDYLDGLTQNQNSEKDPESTGEFTEEDPSERENGQNGSPAETNRNSGVASRIPATVPVPSRTEADDTEPEPISFPYEVPGTTLVIDSINSYDGVFLEDGTDREVYGAAAALIRNTGDRPVEYARIQFEDGGPEFVLTALEPDGIMIVQENNTASYEGTDLYECTAEIAYTESMEMSPDLILTEESEDGSIRLTNISGRDIPFVRLFYKFYMPDQGVYVGGITYNSGISNLAAGQTVSVRPSHYVPDCSRIVMIKAYDSAN